MGIGCSDCGDCDSSDRGCFFSRGMSVIFHRANLLRLVFVICAGIQLSYLTNIWSNGVVNALLAYLLSYTPFNNWCAVLSTGVPTNCRDYQTGTINEQCRQRNLFLNNYASGGNPLTCQEWESNGAIVLQYGKFIGALFSWAWMFCVFQMIIRCWCRAKCRGRNRSPDGRFESESCDDNSPRRPRLREDRELRDIRDARDARDARDVPFLRDTSKIRGGGGGGGGNTENRSSGANRGGDGSNIVPQKKKPSKKPKLSDRVPNIPPPPTMWQPQGQHTHLHHPHMQMSSNVPVVQPILSDMTPADEGSKTNTTTNTSPSTDS